MKEITLGKLKLEDEEHDRHGAYLRLSEEQQEQRIEIKIQLSMCDIRGQAFDTELHVYNSEEAKSSAGKTIIP